jgi:hypothetical protein
MKGTGRVACAQHSRSSMLRYSDRVSNYFKQESDMLHLLTVLIPDIRGL